MRLPTVAADVTGPMTAPGWPAPPRQRAAKAVPARAPITRDLVVTTALRILDAESLDAVSMRRVAQELETGPASLYAHVANKQELLDLMFDRVAGEIELPGTPDGVRWREQARGLAISMHATLTRHSDIARVALANNPTGPNALVVSERMLAVLLAGGVPVQAAAWALDRLTLYVCADAYESSLWGVAVRESGRDVQAYAGEMTGALRSYLAGLPVGHFPNTVKHAAALTSGAGQERFLFGLDLLLDGLVAQVPAPPRRRALR
jgi:AcrR family transcriptional regulator